LFAAADAARGKRERINDGFHGMITDRDLAVLLKLDRYYVCSRPQLQRLCYPTDLTGRVTRRRLQALVSDNLINRHRAAIVYPHTIPAGSIYFPSIKGCQLLCETQGDDRYLLTPTQCPQSHHALHWLAVTETHISLDAAIDAQTDVAVLEWVNEWDIVNKDEQKPEKQYRLYTVLQEEPRLICAPDAAFVLSYRGFNKVFFVEQDRGTSGARQVVARKIKGYFAMNRQGRHLDKFPSCNVNSLTVVCLAPNAGRRDSLRRAFAGKEGSELWRFVTVTEFTADKLLHEPILYPAKGDPMPLVKRLGSETAVGE
jgi:hypothetical protein